MVDCSVGMLVAYLVEYLESEMADYLAGKWDCLTALRSVDYWVVAMAYKMAEWMVVWLVD